MNCPKCNVNLSDESKYCPRCGLLFESNDVKKYSSLFNVDFLEIYFPFKELKFHIDRVSIGYALFTYFYAIYKKMYGIAIISFIIQFFLYLYLQFIGDIGNAAVSIFIPTAFIIMGAIYVYFHYIFSYDRLLIENRTLRINKILRENEDKSKEEIVKIMEEDSKNDLKGLIIAISIVVVLILIKIIL